MLQIIHTFYFIILEKINEKKSKAKSKRIFETIYTTELMLKNILV